MEKRCANCSFYNVMEDEPNCFKHYMEVEPENVCDNFEDKTGDRHDLAYEVGQRLVGTCDFDGQYSHITETFNSQEWASFDEVTYTCGICGWWVDGDDRNESKEVDEDCCYQCVEYEED